MKAMMKLGMRLALASAILPVLAAAPLSAEGVAPDPHWLPWLGCWQAVAPGGGASFSGAPSSEVCVVPTTSPSAVEVLTISNGAVTSRDRIDASGAAQPSSEEGCTGTERVQWSEDGHRLYRTTEQRCTGGIQRNVSGVLAILPTGEWLNAQGVTVGGNTRVHVLRYEPVTDLTGLPAEAARALDGQKLAVEVARSTASVTPTSADIAEASRHLDSDVVGAWLIERGESFTMDAGRLVELANAGVPDDVIDLMVALSYPHKFAINQATGASEIRPDDNGRDSGRRALRPWGYYDPMWGYDPYGYGYGPYRYGYGAGYGWGWGGYNGYYGGYYGSPVVVVRPGNDNEDNSRGTARAVKGRGYTRDGSSRSTGSSSRPSSTRSSGSDRSGSSSSGSARSSGGSSSSGSSGSSTGRTAKPRGN
jgi:hypothetical protein